ncbi:MAG: Asp-tRNA(Asn)/Glu-tRNA(Gln) amidotransferase subunit GatC [Deltaproteobacteria bacterium]|nr:Asp-tRNA(Asn)/Glu-tRNA(Gln) amidotransferase subunit GatC [Deltaproteobacteria bacterium]
MKISLSEVEHVAKLARIRLNEEERTRFLKELNSILDYMDLLSEVDTIDIAPTTHTQHITNALRQDIRRASQPLKDALTNAPETVDNTFVVPMIIK